MKQRQSKHEPLSKSLYYAMRRDLKEVDTYRKGAAVLAIAKKYGVAESTVRTVRLYKTWRAFTEHKERVRARRRSIEAAQRRALQNEIADAFTPRAALKQSAPAPLTKVVIGGIAVVTLFGFLVGLVVVAIIWRLF